MRELWLQEIRGAASGNGVLGGLCAPASVGLREPHLNYMYASLAWSTLTPAYQKIDTYGAWQSRNVGL